MQTKRSARAPASPDAGRAASGNIRSKARFNPGTLGSFVGIVSSLAAGSAFAAPWVVTSTSDDVMDSGSLRYAIVHAAAGDTITFDLPSYPAAIQLTGDGATYLDIQKSLTIIGPGTSKLTITAAHTDMSNDNVFNVSMPASPTADIDVAISALRIEYAGAAIWCSGYAWGTKFKTNLTVDDVVLANNIDGIDVTYSATAAITGSTINGVDSGIYVYSDEPSGGPSSVTIERTTFSGNHAAVYNGGSNVTITNATLVGNGYPSADPYWAAVIGDAASTTTLVYSTISGSAGLATPGLRAEHADGVINLKGTLIAGHPAGNCEADAQIASLGHNLSDDASCSLAGGHDLDDTAAGLDPAGLASNGGTTQTIALLPNSPAMDAVPIADCTDVQDQPLLIDQRGNVRPVGSGCEIGAWELNDRIFAAGFE